MYSEHSGKTPETSWKPSTLLTTEQVGEILRRFESGEKPQGAETQEKTLPAEPMAAVEKARSFKVAAFGENRPGDYGLEDSKTGEFLYSGLTQKQAEYYADHIEELEAIEDAQEKNKERLAELGTKIGSQEMAPEERDEHRARIKLDAYLLRKDLAKLAGDLADGDTKYQSGDWQGRDIFVHAIELAKKYDFDPKAEWDKQNPAPEGEQGRDEDTTTPAHAVTQKTDARNTRSLATSKEQIPPPKETMALPESSARHPVPLQTRILGKNDSETKPQPHTTRDLEVSGVEVAPKPTVMQDLQNADTKKTRGLEKETSELARERKEKLPNPLAQPGTETEKAFEKFNITSGELRAIPGFETLSEGKKLFVLQNLEKLTVGRIQVEATATYREKTSEAKFLGKVWQAFREGTIGKDYKTAKLEKAARTSILASGMQAHEATIRKLVEIAQNNPDVHIAPDGSLMMNYLRPDELLKNTSDQTEREHIEDIVASFNLEAVHIAEIPEDWRLSDSRSERKEYAAAQKAYEESRKQLLSAAARCFGNEQQAALFVAGRDAKVRTNQFLNTNPEAAAQLKAIESKPIWREVARGFALHGLEKGAYAGLGGAVNYATYGILGAAAVGTVRGFLGGMSQTKAALHENTRGLTRQEKATTLNGPFKKTDFMDAENLVERMASLTDKLQQSSSTLNEKEIEITRRNLARLVDFADRKQRAGLVNFGIDPLSARYNMLQKIAESEAYLRTQNFTHDHEKSKKLDQLLQKQASRMSRERWEHIRSQTVKGFAVGLAFGSLGRLIRAYVPTDSLKNWTTDKTPPSHARTSGTLDKIARVMSHQKADEAIVNTKSNQLENRLSGLEEKFKDAILKGSPSEAARSPQVLEIPPIDPKDLPFPSETPPASPPPIGRVTDMPRIEDTERLPTPKSISPVEYATGTSETPPWSTTPRAAETPKAAFTEKAQKGDSVWKMIERQLRSPHAFGEKFDTLPESERIYLIDAFKDEVVEHPEEFGLKDADKVRIDQTIDFEKLLSDHGRLARILDTAEHRLGFSIKHIEHAEETLEAWQALHKDVAPTEANIDEILSLKTPKGGASGSLEIVETEESLRTSPLAPEHTADTRSIFLPEVENRMRKEWDMDPRTYATIRNIRVGAFVSAYQKSHASSLAESGVPAETMQKYTHLAEFIQGHRKTNWKHIDHITIRQFFTYLAQQKR